MRAQDVVDELLVEGCRRHGKQREHSTNKDQGVADENPIPEKLPFLGIPQIRLRATSSGSKTPFAAKSSRRMDSHSMRRGAVRPSGA